MYKKMMFSTVCRVLCVLSFLLMLGVAGGLECGYLSLGYGVFAAAGGLGAFVLFARLGGLIRR